MRVSCVYYCLADYSKGNKGSRVWRLLASSCKCHEASAQDYAEWQYL